MRTPYLGLAVGRGRRRRQARECDLLIVATGWPDYKAIDPAWCKRSNGSRLTVPDLWRTLPAEKLKAHGGTIRIEAGPNGGSFFTLAFRPVR